MFVPHNNTSELTDVLLLLINRRHEVGDFGVLLADLSFAEVMKFCEVLLGLVEVLHFSVEDFLFAVVEFVHAIFDSLIGGDGGYEGFNGFLAAAFEVVEDLFGHLDFCSAKVKFVFEVSAVLDELSSVFS